MWKPICQPEPWLQYLNRKENIGVPLMEVRKKYMQEQLLFENYVSNIQQLNVLSPSSGAGGGPSEATPNLFPDRALLSSLSPVLKGEFEKLNAEEENTRRGLTGIYALPTTIEFLYGKIDNEG